MSQLQAVLATLASLLGLLLLLGSAYVLVRASARDAAMKRLRDENEDLVRRLDWIEPRHRELEQKNSLLMDLHNPTARLEALGAQQQTAIELLQGQSRLLHEIDEKLPHRGGDDG